MSENELGGSASSLTFWETYEVLTLAYRAERWETFTRMLSQLETIAHGHFENEVVKIMKGLYHGKHTD